ncbi:hypothetical protein ACFFGV_03325 [Pontibacillus salicampi]|uniref:YqgU-like 6-bladed beta-propeller domain-containing protein n=1 Tax=Pontibacillus salicampi TaxID=1449801 RepID=A0ABV6LJV2_9BACI
MKKATMLLLFLWLLAGCQTVIHQGDNVEQKTMSIIHKELSPSFLTQKIQHIPYGRVASVHGFIGDDTIVYSSIRERWHVKTMSLETGEITSIYQTENPIVTVRPDPHFMYTFMEEKTPNGGSLITIVNNDGKVIHQQSIQALETDWNWNSFQKGSGVLTAYLEEGASSVTNIHIQEDEVIDSPLPVHAYNKWMNEHQLISFNWGKGLNLVADLELYDTLTGTTTTFERDVLAFEAQKAYYMIVRPEGENDKGTLHFQFWDKQTSEIVASFSIPMLQTHSGHYWLPSYDWNPDTNHFYTFAPKRSASVLEYNEPYELIQFSIDRNREEVIVTDTTHTPIVCSTNNLCLVGERGTKVLHVPSGVIQHVEEGER